MLLRAGLVWLSFLLLAIANGWIREAVLIPRVGPLRGHVVSTILLAILILGVTAAAIRWIRPASSRQAWAIGAGWLLGTLAFEFLGGHFLFGRPWSALLADYDLAGGRIWLLVPLTTLLAPVWAFARQRPR